MSSYAKFTGNTETLETIDALVAERGITREAVIVAIESAMAEATRDRYGLDENVVARMNRKTGEMNIFRTMLVVDRVSDHNREINLNDAKQYDENAEIQVTINEPLPHINIERGTANQMKNAILSEIKKLEKQVEYDEYIKRVGTIVTGFVKKASSYGAIVAIGHKNEAIIPKEGLIFGERFSIKDRVSACIQEVRASDSDFQIILSRSSDEFLRRLLRDEVPEINEGSIEIKAVARDPGSRAKVAVWSPDGSVDPVGACIGPRGSRIKNIVGELRGEKIDIIHWDRDFNNFVKNAIVPAKALKILVTKDFNNQDCAEIVVAKDQLSMAIGARGQNVRLASKIIGCDISLTSEEEKQETAMKTFSNTTAKLVACLDIDELMAQLLAAEGYITIESISAASTTSIARINGFNDEIAAELQERAKEHLAIIDESYAKMTANGFDERIIGMFNFSKSDCVELHKNGITYLKDLADLAADELTEFLPHSITKKTAEKIIMNARRSAYNA